jgi:alkylhydroperoxidase family enzyme
MTDYQHADLLRVMALAAKTNQIANALQMPIDIAFDADQRAT